MAKWNKPAARRSGFPLRALLAAAVVVLLIVGGALAYVFNQYGVGIHGDPLRLLGLVQANFANGCAPDVNPIACRVAGRAWRVQNSGAPHGLRAEGNYLDAFRFELRAGDKWSKDIRLKAKLGPGHGVERDELSDLKRQPYDKDIWFGFTMLVEPGPPTTADWVNLGQLHNTPDKDEMSASPPWVQGFGAGDRFRIFIRHTGENPLRHNPQPIILFEDPAFKRGHAYRFVYHLKLAPTGAGLAQVWRDGRLIGDYRGPLGYPDKTGPYFKFGIYRSPASETMVVHYAAVRLGDAPLQP